MELNRGIKKGYFQHWDIVLSVVGIVLINIGLRQWLVRNTNFLSFFLFDATSILISVFIGKKLVDKVTFPLWWNRDNSIGFLKQIIIIIALGLPIIILNFVFSDASILYAFNLLSKREIIFLSLRAGLQEEIVFRLLMFTGSTYFISKITKSHKKSVVMGILLSSLVFMLPHGLINIWAFTCGVILAYVYYKNGLIPAIIIHFLADAIPWGLIYYLNK